MTMGKKLATHVAPTGWLLIILSCLGLLAGCLSDTFDAAYGNLAEARADGAIDRGWIPAWVPESATALHEVHNLDTNVSALAFDLPGDTRIPLPDGCLPATYAQTLPVRFARSWWPSQGTLASQYNFFTCPAPYTGFEFVGMRHDGRHMVHWRTYAPD